ncbi:hypothetical protein DFJ73DRAFT_778476 [Zopfochytrium polystomum]|nr:hypothetical protein DFJ73DRAFT_778476 [Zopfochytrium polystomum]
MPTSPDDPRRTVATMSHIGVNPKIALSLDQLLESHGVSLVDEGTRALLVSSDLGSWYFRSNCHNLGDVLAAAGVEQSQPLGQVLDTMEEECRALDSYINWFYAFGRVE